MTDIFSQPSRDPLGDIAVYLDEALYALTMTGGVRIDCRTGEESEMAPIELCCSEELERIDRVLRRDRETPTVLDIYAKEMKRAMLAVHAAQTALKRLRR